MFAKNLLPCCDGKLVNFHSLSELAVLEENTDESYAINNSILNGAIFLPSCGFPAETNVTSRRFVDILLLFNARMYAFLAKSRPNINIPRRALLDLDTFDHGVFDGKLQ